MKKVNLSIEKKSYGVRESIRTLRTNLQFCGDDKRVILVTSCVPREGKSSVSVALAESIADMGKSVILVDADIRNSVMASKLQITGADKGLSHFLSGQCVLADVIMATNIPKFHILLSGPEAPNPTELLESKRFTGMLDSMKNVYDYIIIDCPPSLNLLTINAMTAADSVIVPIQCEYYALEGLSQLIHTIDLIKERLNPKLEIEGVVFTMYDARTNLSLQVVENVKENLDKNIYKTIIPRNVRLAEAPSYGMPINMYDSRSAGAEAYRYLAEEVIEKEDENEWL